MNQAKDGGTDGMMTEETVINGQIDTFGDRGNRSADRPDVGGGTNRKVKNGTKISGPNS